MKAAQEKIRQDTGMPGWLELYDLSLHGDMEAQAPSGVLLQQTERVSLPSQSLPF